MSGIASIAADMGLIKLDILDYCSRLNEQCFQHCEDSMFYNCELAGDNSWEYMFYGDGRWIDNYEIKRLLNGKCETKK